ncbi:MULTISPECIES: DUF6482 family protein [Salinicola]|uniref:Uncharacterized protein n=1 Tax=Salinicola socius TaxID=404433 RepID=A0A1Q8SPW1_9GAMM|nr:MULTISPECIES: DUF6482 family protein [Salinicola]OLO03456.1 hypothetical protein BTW07_14010 [Salinicola socius]
MELKELEHYQRHHESFEIRVIAHAGSRYYQVMLEPEDGSTQVLTRRGKPMLFRALDDVYGELKRAGIHRAYLVQQVANDEIVGHEPHYHDPLLSRMPLVF